jgi:hypothetical protein
MLPDGVGALLYSGSFGFYFVLAAPGGIVMRTILFLSGFRKLRFQAHDLENNHAWKSVRDESLYVPFFLEDTTRRVLIDPQGADLDVHRSFSDEIGASLFRTDGPW